MFSTVFEGLVVLSDDALDERIRELEERRRRLDAELAATIAVADARQVNLQHGHRTMKGYLRATCNWSNGEVARWRGLARVVDTTPGVGEAWMSGHIGLPQAVSFAKAHGNRRVRDRLGEFAPMLIDHAEQLPHDDFQRTVDHFIAMADDDGSFDHRVDAIEHRVARISHVDGVLSVTATGGDALCTAEIMTIFDDFAEREFQADLRARRDRWGDDAVNQPLRRTAAQRRFDALIEVFRRANGTDAPGLSPKTVVNIVIDSATFGRMQQRAELAPTAVGGRSVDPFTGLATDGPLLDELCGRPDDLLGRRCETSNGVPLHPLDVLRASLAGHVRRVVVDRAGVVIDQGREQRLYTGSARTAAMLLVRTCRFAGCDLPGSICQVDHNAEWVAEGGTTDQSNADVQCPTHNRWKYRRRWRSRRATNGHTYTVRDDGTTVLPVGARPPTFDDSDARKKPDGRRLADPVELARPDRLT